MQYDNYADVLESYLVPSEESGAGIAATIAAIGLAALGLSTLTRKQKERVARSKEEYQRWLNSSEGQTAIAYVKKKYGVDYNNITNSNELNRKISASILTDAKKIAAKLNSDSKLREMLIKNAEDDNQELTPREIHAIKAGKLYSIDEKRVVSRPQDDYLEFDVNGVPEDIVKWIPGYIEAFTTPLNKKYENEIALRLITELESSEGIDIGCQFLTQDKKGTESYLEPATEGLFGLFVGLPLVLGLGAVMIEPKLRAKQQKRYQQRMASPTPGELESYKNLEESWVPAIKQYASDVRKLFAKVPGATKLLEFSTPVYHKESPNFDFADINYGELEDYYDENSKENERFSALFNDEKFKAAVAKAAAMAKKFSPYFQLVIDQADYDDEKRFSLALECKHLDRDQILKPGLPPFKG